MYSVEAMLSAGSFGELLARYKYLHLVALRDRALVTRMATLGNEIGQQRQSLVRLRNNAEQSRADKAGEERRLRSLEQQRGRSLAQAESQQKQVEARLAQIARDEARVAAIIASLDEARRRSDARPGESASRADVIQLDEPWLRNNPEEAKRYAVKVINRALQGITVPTVVHLCFGYAAVVTGLKPTGYSFLPQLADTTAAQISIEAAQPRLDLSVLRELRNKVVMLGVIDLGTEAVETPQTVAARIRTALRIVPAERLVVPARVIDIAERCGFLDVEKEGRCVYYSVAEPHLGRIMACIEDRFGQ